jgi:hypothetical protein
MKAQLGDIKIWNPDELFETLKKISGDVNYHSIAVDLSSEPIGGKTTLEYQLMAQKLKDGDMISFIDSEYHEPYKDNVIVMDSLNAMKLKWDGNLYGWAKGKIQDVLDIMLFHKGGKS